MNILFLTVSAGGGHTKAAEAIKEQIENYYPGSKTQIVDAYKYVSPTIDKVVIGGYLKALKNSPRLWGKIYELAEKGNNVNDLSKTLNKILSIRIKKMIKDFAPDVVVCTHPFTLQIACHLKKKSYLDAPIVSIITDFAAHTLWINEIVDHYIVAHENLVPEMLERGVAKEKIFSLGIPVSSKFLSIKEKNKVLSDFRLEDKTTFLIMGGSLGIGEIKKIFIKLLKSRRDIQIVVVCGKNSKLKKQLESTYIKLMSKKRAIILGFTDRVHELMSVSHVIVTKPGGLTVTESLIMGLPIIIISPIPGQEERNSSYLLNNGVAVRLDDIDNMERIISQFLDNPLRLKHIKEMSQYLAKPHSSENIAKLLARISKKESTS